MSAPKTKKRIIYPLELKAPIPSLLAKARKQTGVKNRAALMRMSIERGLPLVVESLTKHRHAIQN